jgi:hypothetical protein
MHAACSVSDLVLDWSVWGVPTLQIPHATVHSSLVADAWFAWHSMPEAEVVSKRLGLPSIYAGTHIGP